MPRDWAVDVRPTSTNSTSPAARAHGGVVRRVLGPYESNEESGGRISIVTPDGRRRRILRRLTSLRLLYLAPFASG